MSREAHAQRTLGSLHQRIQKERILIVGAGGIGCELLKNCVLLGYGEIHVVDLDTIDLSNLNRQFLFRKEHIKRPKALVAKESAGIFNPAVHIEAHHANIKEPQFSLSWFRGFDLVYNALDNLEARRHVNKMCLASNRTLIESGTTGFNGQVQVIAKGQTECYDCNPKETPKTYPVCTIRSTPSQPIHCVVWAKSYLFCEVFGTSEDDTGSLDHAESAENAKEIRELEKEGQALRAIRAAFGTEAFLRTLFEKVFEEDIVRLRAMEDMWKHRPKPEALDFDRLTESSEHIKSDSICQVQRSWTREENFVKFKSSSMRLSARVLSASDNGNNNGLKALSFDKDDEDTLDFVVAAANLRSIVFGIPHKSKFEIKQMAGNIIPAIATTNAMTASLCVLQALKVSANRLDEAKMVFLERPGARVINSEALRPPNSDCQVCGCTYGELFIDPARTTLNDLVEVVLREQLKYGEEFSINNNVGVVYDPDLEDNLPSLLQDLNISQNDFISIIDDAEEDVRVNLVLYISTRSFDADSVPIYLEEGLEIPIKPQPVESNGHSASINGHTELLLPSTQDPLTRKRRQSTAETQQGGKKSKIAESEDLQEPALIIEGNNDGSIVIGDD